MKKLALWGAGGLGLQIYELAEWQNSEEPCWEEIFFVDDWKPEGELYGTRNLHFETVKKQFSPNEIEFIVALGDPVDKRKRFHEIENAGYDLGRVIAPNARVSKSAKLGRSVILQVGSLAEPEVVLGDGVTVEDYAAIGHGTSVGDFCHVCAKTTIGGGSNIGQGTFIGLHSIFKQGSNIGEYVTVGMGSVVVKDIPDKVVVVGNPARIIKNRDENTKVF